MRVLGVIPVRLESTRLPGKPLALIGERPMVLRVLDHARRAPGLNRVVVATDSSRIAEVVRADGGEVVVTPEAASGSDRAAWVLKRFKREGSSYDALLNIQGDEPFLGSEAMGAAVGALDCGAQMTTLATFLKPQDKDKPQVVKVLMSPDGRALDFSRRARGGAGKARWLKHIGIYGFRSRYMERFVSLPQATREREERLEQLRALEDQAWIQVVVGGDWDPLGVDTAEDLAAARRRWAAGERRGHFGKNGELV